MKFKVTVKREWDEYGEIIVDAEDDDEARDIVEDILSCGGDEINWHEMESTQDSIESVEEDE